MHFPIENARNVMKKNHHRRRRLVDSQRSWDQHSTAGSDAHLEDVRCCGSPVNMALNMVMFHWVIIDEYHDYSWY